MWNDLIKLVQSRAPESEWLRMQDGEHGATALHRAVEYAPKDVIVAMLSQGALPQQRDNYGRTALHRAAFHTRPDVVEVLLAHDSDPLLRLQFRDALDFDGKSALDKANYRKHAQIIKFLSGA